MAFFKRRKQWPPKLGVTIGKFKPLHRGHELMITMAAAEMEELTVIVSDSKDGDYAGDIYIPLAFRYKMVKQAFQHLDNVRVMMHTETHGDAEHYDRYGTALDESFWDYWVDVFDILAPEANYFVSSDRYGQVAASRIGAKDKTRDMFWFPVDPDRELVPVSGTDIRNDPITNWRYIHPMFRQSFGKRVTIIGPESTGKTTLARDVARSMNSPYVPEYGRTLSEAVGNNMTADHFHDIIKRHHEMELFAISNSETGLTVSDTDSVTTYLFSKIYLGKPIEDLRKYTQGWYDLVILLPPDLPWIDDGTRVISNLKTRIEFFKDLKRMYNRHPNLLVLEETDHKRRVEIVCDHISRMMRPVNKSSEEAFERLTSQDTSLII